MFTFLTGLGRIALALGALSAHAIVSDALVGFEHLPEQVCSVELESKARGRAGRCSATIVSPRHVFLSAHCLVSEFSGGTVTCPWGVKRKIIKTAKSGVYDPKVEISDRNHMHDLAWAEVDQDFGIDPITPFLRPESISYLVKTSECYTLGYGFDREGRDGVLNGAVIEAKGKESARPVVGWDNDVISYQKNMIMTGLAANTRTKKGDSGGPLLCVDIDQTLKLVATNTAVGGGFSWYTPLANEPEIIRAIPQLGRAASAKSRTETVHVQTKALANALGSCLTLTAKKFEGRLSADYVAFQAEVHAHLFAQKDRELHGVEDKSANKALLADCFNWHDHLAKDSALLPSEWMEIERVLAVYDSLSPVPSVDTLNVREHEHNSRAHLYGALLMSELNNVNGVVEAAIPRAFLDTYARLLRSQGLPALKSTQSEVLWNDIGAKVSPDFTRSVHAAIGQELRKVPGTELRTRPLDALRYTEIYVRLITQALHDVAVTLGEQGHIPWNNALEQAWEREQEAVLAKTSKAYVDVLAPRLEAVRKSFLDQDDALTRAKAEAKKNSSY